MNKLMSIILIDCRHLLRACATVSIVSPAVDVSVQYSRLSHSADSVCTRVVGATGIAMDSADPTKRATPVVGTPSAS